MLKRWARQGGSLESSKRRKLVLDSKNPIDSIIAPSDWVAVPIGSPKTAYPEGWTALNGDIGENSIEERVLPNGDTGLVWVCHTTGGNNASGGFHGGGGYIDVDPHRTYRISAWLKKTGSHAGNVYLGFYPRDSSNANHGVRSVYSDEVVTNPYVYSKDLPTLDTWYLVYGFIRPLDFPLASSREGRVKERMDTTSKGSVTSEYRFQPDTKKLGVRIYDYYDATVGSELEIYMPRLDLVGECPSIEDLLGNP